MSNDRYDLDAAKSVQVDRKRVKLLYISTAKYGGDWHSLLHTHNCTELFYVLGGMGQFKIEEKTIPVEAGDFIIVNPNVEHTETSSNSTPMEYFALGVEGLEFAPGEEGDGQYAVLDVRGSGEELSFYLRAMLRELETKAAGYEVVCQDLLEVLAVGRLGGTACKLSPAGRRSSKECALVRRYIDSHFKENITLDMLAALAHVNKYYLVHAFSREYGISPISYLIERRIQESRHLLASTDHSLSLISHMLGFSSPSYFSQSFRRQEGMSPLEYRKRARTEAAL